jgi:hypothetical protein
MLSAGRGAGSNVLLVGSKDPRANSVTSPTRGAGVRWAGAPFAAGPRRPPYGSCSAHVVAQVARAVAAPLPLRSGVGCRLAHATLEKAGG